MFMYFLVMVYEYHSRLGFLSIKHDEEGKDIHNDIFNNIPYFIKNCLHFNCLQDRFVMYNDKVLRIKQEVVPPIPDSVIPVYSCQNNYHVINFTNDDMRSKFGAFSKDKIGVLYLTKIMITE